jgi:glycosyltransferase involved in cell wall biosynthesis
VKYDVQAFQRKSHGGIATYFIELSSQILALKESKVEILQDGILTSNQSLVKNSFFPMTYKSKYLLPIARTLNANVSRIRNYDIIHSTYYFESFLREIPKESHIITIHDMIPEDFPEFFPNGNPHEAKSQYINQSSGIICVSNYTKSRLLAHNPGIDEKRIRVIHHASKFKSGQREITLRWASRNSPTKDKTLLYVGARSGYKNFEILIPAMRCLIHDGWNVRLICVGGGEFSADEVEKMQTFGVFNYIHQTSASDEKLKEYYLSADCHITTSLDEGFGLPLLEAMSLGCPTIITSAGSLKEISEGNSLEFTSSDELVAKILNVIGDRSLSLEMSQGGYSRARNFDWAITAKQTVQLYKEVSLFQ